MQGGKENDSGSNGGDEAPSSKAAEAGPSAAPAPTPAAASGGKKRKKEEAAASEAAAGSGSAAAAADEGKKKAKGKEKEKKPTKADEAFLAALGEADAARLKAGTPAERCAVVLELLGKRQDGFWFAEPVTDEIAPGYSDEIETPMDYQTAAEKLAAGAYADGAAAFAADVHLIYANARKFNYFDKSPCHVAATAAGAALEKMLTPPSATARRAARRGRARRRRARRSRWRWRRRAARSCGSRR